MMRPMATYRISETDAARDLSSLLDRVRAGAEVVIEAENQPIAVMVQPAPPRRSIEECIALLPPDSPALIDSGFAADVAGSVEFHRESLNPPAWN